ncbi:ABC transporter substrate-binding protein [Nocardiopsis sp. NRRL B-16309]|uniref:ABC transporter substrate-binding protein n=1 Tax=Nocardiopsis sp. NRRL B-16309 TaxID=1519494 RepID=UPI0006B06756|nr:ABC transporter substrate-binding protein [Nocardiopsis sp. NRRL B-16309]KOX17344.1 ABC transporter substrate-binding protein [Nocardiopsis sp. NRRL B-16309]
MRSRWRSVAAGALGLALLASACAGGGQDGGEGRVEVFSWWTGGGEEAGLNALIELFEDRNPDVEFVNATVAGGSGTNAQAVLDARLQSQDPPDSFQGHAGAELQDYIEAGYLQSLDDFFDEQGLRTALSDRLLEQITYEGSVYSVPLNIHRSNVLWYSPSVLEEAGIDGPPESLDELIEAMEAVRTGTDAVPLAVGEQWTVDHLLESVLLGSLGTEAYNALWEPGADWDTPEMAEALATFEDVLSYTQEGAADEDWQEAARRVPEGEAAFNIMGDWTVAYYDELGAIPNEDYAWAASPGTEGTYLWLSDSFTLPVDAPHEEHALAWLELVASQEGQDTFNPLKGSIPAREDAEAAHYADNPYLESALAEWRSDPQLAGSFWHGVTVGNRWKNDIDTAVGRYLRNGDLEALNAALHQAAQSG